MGETAWILKHEDGSVITDPIQLDMLMQYIEDMEVGKTLLVEHIEA